MSAWYIGLKLRVSQSMPYKISIYKAAEEKQQAEADINAYYEVRKIAYKKKWNKSDYDEYPNSCDRLNDTIFLIIKVIDDTGKEIVAGGRRIIFPDNNGSPSLNKSPIAQPPLKLADKFKKGGYLAMNNVVPAINVEPNLKYAEMGGFAIDQELTAKLLSREEYKSMREAIYKQAFDVLTDCKVDLAISFIQKSLRINYMKWLKNNGYEHNSLAAIKGMITNILPEEHALEALIVNISNKYKLKGEDGILRFNQTSASEARSR